MANLTYSQCWRPLSNFSLKSIEKEIQAYSWYPDGEYINVARLTRDGRGSTRNSGKASTVASWLTSIGVLEKRKIGIEVSRRLTRTGYYLAMALRERDQDGIRICWREIVLSSDPMKKWFEDNIGAKIDVELVTATDNAKGKADTYIKTGKKALIDIFKAARLLDMDWEGNKAKYIRMHEAWLREPKGSEQIDKYLSNKKALAALGAPYVDLERLGQLEEIQSSMSRKFDLSKLIALCKELNTCYEKDCYFAVAMLVRAIMDHIPPTFGLKSFAEISVNYSHGSKSFRQHMSNLDNSLRKIADAHLHTQIRKSETLPNPTQIDFNSDLDVLLAEVVRLLQVP